MNSQTKESSYRKLFSKIEKENDFFELEIIKRIKEDYISNHTNDFKKIELLLNRNNDLACPKCGRKDFLKNGLDKNGTQRYLCPRCHKSFNVASSSLLFSSKVNIRSWFVFLESLLSGSSMRNACIMAKISYVTGTQWLNKVFLVLKDYQNDIVLDKSIYIDETYIHEDQSKIFLFDEIGKIKKVKKEPRGISRNKICILVATDCKKSFAEIVCHGRPQKLKNYEICKRHIVEGATIIGDEDTSLTFTANKMNLTRRMYKAYTYEAFEALEPIDQLCSRLKFFIDKHRGFKKEKLADYLNLFIFIDNENYSLGDLYLVTKKLLKMIFEYKKDE